MAASWWKLGLALGVSSAFAAMIPSCADNEVSIFIRQMQLPLAPQCVATADPNGIVIFGGLLDVGIQSNYIAYPLVGNQLVARGDARTSRAEPNRVVIEGAEIRLLDASDNLLRAAGGEVGAFTVVAAGTVDPSAGADARFGVTAVEVIPPLVGLRLRADLAGSGIGARRTFKAEIRIFGRTLGGTEVETGPYVMPMEVCYGCTVNVPADAVEPTIPGPNCKSTNAGGAAGAGQLQACRVGQDFATDCRLCQGRLPLCTPCSTDTDCAGMQNTTDPTKPSTCNTAVRFCQ